MGPALRWAPVVSGAARIQLAPWRIWLCARTTLPRSGVRRSASTDFSTSSKPRNARARITTLLQHRAARRRQLSNLARGRRLLDRRDFRHGRAEHGNDRRPQGRGGPARISLPRYLRPSFKRQFSLADHVQVKSAAFEDGLLRIALFREVPEAMKPRRIAINGTVAGNVQQIEAKAGPKPVSPRRRNLRLPPGLCGREAFPPLGRTR